MNNYIKKFSKIPDFECGNFFKGYCLSSKFGVEVDYIDMMIGHEFYQKESESVHIYYILEGEGLASINGKVYPIESGDTVEIPIDTEFAFKGNLKMIEIMKPPFNPETHIDTMENEL